MAGECSEAPFRSWLRWPRNLAHTTGIAQREISRYFSQKVLILLAMIMHMICINSVFLHKLSFWVNMFGARSFLLPTQVCLYSYVCYCFILFYDFRCLRSSFGQSLSLNKRCTKPKYGNITDLQAKKYFTNCHLFIHKMKIFFFFFLLLGVKISVRLQRKKKS